MSRHRWGISSRADKLPLGLERNAKCQVCWMLMATRVRPDARRGHSRGAVYESVYVLDGVEIPMPRGKTPPCQPRAA